jgi:hypothetical protein
MNHFPQAPDNNIRIISKFFENSRRYSQGKSRCTTGVNDTGGKLPPVSTTPAANFATSSPCVVDTGGKFAAGVNDAGGK